MNELVNTILVGSTIPFYAIPEAKKNDLARHSHDLAAKVAGARTADKD
jgi:hypothetical protein